jgi:3-phytase
MFNRCSIVLMIGCAALVGCGSGKPEPSASSTSVAAAHVQVLAETAGSAQDNGNDVAFWIHPSDPKRSLVLVSAGTAGLEAFGLDGTRAAHFTGGEFDYVDVSYGSGTGAGDGAIVVAYDRKQRGLWALTIDPQSLAISAVSKNAFRTGGEVVGLCAYRSAVTGDQYAFAATNGLLEQWKLYVVDGEVRGTLVRTIPIGTGAAYCATDAQLRSVYVTEETVGIWKLAAEPETEAERSAVDLIAPFGTLEEEV